MLRSEYAENDLKRGKIALFFDRGKLHLGLIKDEYKNQNKLLILSETKEEKIIRELQLYFISSVATDEKSFFALAERIRNLEKEIDIRTLWEIAISTPDLKEITEDEMLMALFQESSGELKIALKLKLHSDENIFFKKKINDLWEIIQEEKVKKIEQEREIKRQEEERILKFKKWIHSNKDFIEKVKNLPITDFFSGNFPTYPNSDLDDDIRFFLGELKNLFLGKDVKQTIRSALSYISDIKESTIFKILCAFSVIHPYENFFIEKFGLDVKKFSSEIKIDIVQNITGREKIDIETYSLDIEGTEIRDDAVSIPEEADDCSTEIFVHIIDISVIDTPEVIDRVLKMGKSFYFPEGKIDMLSESIARTLSLDSGMIKPAITFKIKVSLKEHRIDVIKVDVAKTAVKILKNYEFSSCDEKLEKIRDLGKRLYKIRVLDNGGVDLICEDLIILIKNGNKEVLRWGVNDYRIALSEIMMLCAHAIAKFCKENKIPIYYRRSNITREAKEEIRKFNNEAITLNLPRPYILWRNIRAARHIETTIEPSGAESIGYDLYAWGTSPIRRAWDFINILQIGRFLDGKKLFSEEELEKMKTKIEVAISNAETAEDKRYKYILSAHILQELRNKEFSALVVESGKIHTYWVDEIASFVKGKSKSGADVLKYVKVKLEADPVEQTIKVIEI